MTKKEWAELEPGMVLAYDHFTYRTVSKDNTGRWLVEKLDQWNQPTSVVSLNVDDKRLKQFEVIKRHVASAEVRHELQQTEKRKIN